MGVVGQQQSAAVARLLRDITRAHRAARAGTALDNDVLAEPVLELFGKNARRHVGRSAGRKRHDDPDDVFGADGLGSRHRTGQHGQRHAQPGKAAPNGRA